MPVRKKIFKFLTGYVLRLRFFHFLIIIIVSVSIMVFSSRIRDLDDFIRDFLTTKTEGSLSEYNPFLNMLITEINKRAKNAQVDEDHLKNKIKEKLELTKQRLEGIKIGPLSSSRDSAPADAAVNIDKLQYNELYKYLDYERAKNLSLKNLNLEAKQVELDVKISKPQVAKIDRYVIQTQSADEDSFTPGSFVFLPTQLTNVDENSIIDISPDLKQEIVFSKIAEKELHEILGKILQAEQVYFISLRGFIRICRKGGSKPVKDFNGKFSYKQSFADRTYFAPTLKIGFRESFPYVDIGGLGIVRTYTISILNPEFNLVGVIGVDIPMASVKDVLEKVPLTLGIGFFKNVLLEFSEGNLKEAERKKIEEFKNQEENQAKFFTEVNRFDSGSRIIYSVPVAKDSVVYVIFDKDRLWKNTLFFIATIALVLAVISWLIYFVYRQSIKSIKAQENQFDLISNMHYSYVITNKNNQILSYNQEFENLVEMGNLEGVNFEDFLTEESLKDFKFYNGSGKERFECPLTIKGKKGTRKSVILVNGRTDHPFQKGSRVSVIIESEDIESLVAGKYIDKLYHLLKTPLHSILGIADQLRRKSAAPRYNEYYILLDNTIKELSRAISRLLEISKLEFRHLRPELEIINFTKMIENIKREFSELARKKKVSFYCNIADGLTIQADRNMVKTTIENILDNALKYTPAGEILLHLQDAGSKVKVLIKDTGIGIPPDEIDLIFNKKFRGKHLVVQKMDGQGIGLYQCWHFVALNKGEISVTSVPGKGSEFTVVFHKKIEDL